MHKERNIVIVSFPAFRLDYSVDFLFNQIAMMEIIGFFLTMT